MTPEANPTASPPPAPPAARGGLAARLRALHADRRAGATLEWALLLGCIALPAYALIVLGLNIITAHFGMVLTVNSLPFP